MDTTQIRVSPGAPQRPAKKKAPPPPPVVKPKAQPPLGLVAVRPAPPPPSTKPRLVDYLLDPLDGFQPVTGSKMQSRRVLTTTSLPALRHTGDTEASRTPDSGRGQLQGDHAPGHKHVEETSRKESGLKYAERERDSLYEQVGNYEDEKENGGIHIEKDPIFEGVVLRKTKSSRSIHETLGVCFGVDDELSNNVFYDFVGDPDPSRDVTRGVSEVRDSTYEAFAALDEAILSHSRENIYEDIDFLETEEDTDVIQFRFQDNKGSHQSASEMGSETQAIPKPHTRSVSELDNKATHPPANWTRLKTEVAGEIVMKETKAIPKPYTGSVSELDNKATHPSTSSTHLKTEGEIASKAVPKPDTESVSELDNKATHPSASSTHLKTEGEIVSKAVPKPAPRRLVPDAKTSVPALDRHEVTPHRTAPRPVTRKALLKREPVSPYNAKGILNTSTQRDISSGPIITGATKVNNSSNPIGESSIDEGSVLSRVDPLTAVDQPNSPTTLESNTLKSPLPTADSEPLHPRVFDISLEEDETNGLDTSAKILSTKERATSVDREHNLSEHSQGDPKREDGGKQDGVEKLNWDPEKCFTMDDVEDPQMRLLFENAGVTDDELQDPRTRDFIYRFLLNHGGMEAVKREAHFKATLRLVKKQPRTRLGKEYVPRKNHATYL